MKFLILLILISNLALANHPPHMDLEMTSEEYRILLNNIEKNQPKNKNEITIDDAAITEALKYGMRLSEWVALINTGRTSDTAIRLTSATTRTGTPIDKPKAYSPSIIKQATNEILSHLPKEMKDALLGSGKLPGAIALDDPTFILHARKIDKNYQSAARYKSLIPYKLFYIGKSKNDVRGYYFLVQNKISEATLKDVGTIPASMLTPIKGALFMVCMNYMNSQGDCEEELEDAVKKNSLDKFYQKYFPFGKKNWDEFFKIPSYAKRKDVNWSGSTFTVPFNTPSLPQFGPYLKDNIEDEYRFDQWGLKLRFGSYSNGPRLLFQSGVVPHVDQLGGNNIVMDSTQPIEEYESQWTIRHEFGHVLGLPDCYHEFYDLKLDAFVQYQLDIKDLMCSRAGNMNERIFLELKETYGH